MSEEIINTVEAEFIVNKNNRKIREIKGILMSLYMLTVMIIYLVFSWTFDIWHPLWVIFLTTPLYSSLIEAILRKKASYFSIELLAIAVFVTVGVTTDQWHPTWAILLIIPIYRLTVDSIRRIKKIRKEE